MMICLQFDMSGNKISCMFYGTEGYATIESGVIDSANNIYLVGSYTGASYMNQQSDGAEYSTNAIFSKVRRRSWLCFILDVGCRLKIAHITCCLVQCVGHVWRDSFVFRPLRRP